MKAAPHQRPFFDARKLGAKCDECPLKGHNPVLPQKRRNAKLVILGEAPGEHEEMQGEPFIGKSGKLLDRALQQARYPRATTHVTNAILCRPPYRFTPTQWREALSCCKPRLERELPKKAVVAALGKAALQTMTGKGKIIPWIGAALPEGGRQILPTVHPSYALRKPAWIPVFKIHLERAVRLAEGKAKPFRWPLLVVEDGFPARKMVSAMLSDDFPIAVDVETAGKDSLKAPLTCIGFATTKRGAVSVPYPAQPETDELIKTLLLTKQLTFQNGAYDIIALAQHGYDVENYSFDTLLAHAVAAPQLPHDLGFIACVETNAPRWKTVYRGGGSLERTYNAQDAYITAVLRERLSKRLDQTHNGWVLFDSEELGGYMPLMKLAIKMREEGILVNSSRLEYHRQSLRKRRWAAYNDLRHIARRVKFKGWKRFNPNSNRQLHRLVFGHLGVKPSRFSLKTGAPSINDAVLDKLVVHPKILVALAARALLRFRRWNKLLSTYVKKLVGVDYVHPTWKPWAAITGRWGCAQPNLMNVPKPTEKRLKDGRMITTVPGLRDLFMARPGMYFVEVDYKQLELIIMSLLTDDTKLLAWFRADVDVHYENAKELFEVAEPSDDHRQLAKRFVYAAIYGAESRTIWQSLVIDFPDLTLAMVDHLRRRWFKVHSCFVQWQNAVLREVRLNGYIEAPLSGRREYFHDGIKKDDIAKIFNFKAQTTGIDIINPPTLQIAKELRPNEGIRAQVHDALLLEGPDPVRLVQLATKYMERVITLNSQTIKFGVDYKVGRDWGNVVKCKTIKDVQEYVKKVV